MFDFSIGKFTLESLTTGMYSDARIVFREYIQNSVDSLEEAVRNSIIEKNSMRIDIVISDERNYISIRDNGIGIKASETVSTLLSIGNSKKRHESNRGFRGIGRLGGMSYCDQLVFTTSYEGEEVATRVTFNCQKLRELLVPGIFEEHNLASVLSAITTVDTIEDSEENHFFLVEMCGVDTLSGLLDLNDAKDYISQVAPIQYRSRLFVRSLELHQYAEKNGYFIEEVPIFIGNNSMTDCSPVYKPVRHRFHSDRNKMRHDEILEMRYFDVKVANELYAIGWYAVSNWYGTISEANISGIRVRKGNILIGDSKTMNVIFKEPRFNGWVQGEIFVISKDLIPNARRDDFERNDSYYVFVKKLSESIGVEISSAIREASKKRNDPTGKVLRNIQNTLTEANVMLQEGFNSSVEKDKTSEDLVRAENILRSTIVNAEQQTLKNELAQKIAKTQESVIESKNYKINQVSAKLDRKSKKVLEIISNVLSKKLSKFLVDEIIDEIISEFERRP